MHIHVNVLYCTNFYTFYMCVMVKAWEKAVCVLIIYQMERHYLELSLSSGQRLSTRLLVSSIYVLM